MSEPADSGPSGASGPSQLSAMTLEDLGLLLAGDLTSPETLSLEELSERYESSHPPSTASVPEQDTAKRWNQLEQWVVELQAEVACLREHKQRCERTTRSLLRELLQVRARVQLQGSERRQLQQEVRPAAQAPEKEAPEFSGLQNQMQALDKRLVEVREALAQLRRRQAQQEAERRGAEQEAGLRLAKLTDLLQQEEQGREVACGALQKNQEDSSRRVDLEVARMQAQVTKLGEEVSLRFLKREAKLCGFLQKSFLALEKVGVCLRPACPAPLSRRRPAADRGVSPQRMKASESSRLRLEGSLRGELESRWEKLRGLMEERLRALQGQHEESHLLEQCQGLDAAVAQLTKFVQQNQASLNRVLLAEAKAWDAKGRLEESRAGELAAYVQESLEAAQLARALARQEMHGELVLLREKNRALEASVAQLAGQLKELSGRLPALSSRLDLQEQTLGLRLSEVRQAAEGRQGYGESPPRRLSAHHCPQGRGWTGQSQASHHPATVPRAQETPSSRDSCVGWDGRWAASAHGAAMQAVTERQTSSLHPSCSCSLCTSSIETDSLPTRFTREQAKTEWEGAERKSLEDLARWQKEVAAHLRGVREKVDGLPQQIEGVSDKCLLHKSDSDLRISAEGKAREFEVGALRQELATLLSSVQLLKEDSPGRKIAEMQGKLATFQNQIMKLENCVQASKTIQNLRFNTEARLRTQEMAALRESVLQLRSEGGLQTPLDSWKLLPSLARLRVFIKDTAPNEVVPVNCWGVYQAVRWLQWKASLIKLRAPRRPGGVPEKPHRQEQVQQLTPSLFIQK
ncbi:coiled-coil domain-containing protein 154 isoform X2 [Chlorocebus sabaeus]|uniref:coiled-coil domain-containing protein 154 isoform X2 n=1 Tax=Chlorocebus sabaeus TaxID=60711 RepID=UPI0018B0EE0D|nr:coiled-coil domain-containing protein 154 isoform X2 [Chlorocebus sabaeus]